ncbi:MAG: hypothetical protein KAG96_01410 [Ichthyobacteriaceae bacterium]|nr:hypothetical protein [Ichthyobacteriaceae bacterium]
MKKIAVPTANGKLSAHFGGSEFFTVFEIENNKVIKEEVLETPEHITGSYPNFLASNNVTDIIVGGVGRRAIDIFNSKNITVYSGEVKLVAEVVEDLLAGKLATTGKSCKEDGTKAEGVQGPGHEDRTDN